MPHKTKPRAFKTKKFSKDAKNAHISGAELCDAIKDGYGVAGCWFRWWCLQEETQQEPAPIDILAKGREYWIYEYLFAKKERDNIDDAELEMFRLLAKGYAGLKNAQLAQLIEEKHLLEICYDDEKEI